MKFNPKGFVAPSFEFSDLDMAFPTALLYGPFTTALGFRIQRFMKLETEALDSPIFRRRWLQRILVPGCFIGIIISNPNPFSFQRSVRTYKKYAVEG